MFAWVYISDEESIFYVIWEGTLEYNFKIINSQLKILKLIIVIKHRVMSISGDFKTSEKIA